MKRLLLFLILLCTVPLEAQIIVTANVPTSANITNDGIPVFVGATRQININIGNGIVNAVTLVFTGYSADSTTPISGSGYVSGDVGSYLTILQAGSSDTATVQITGVYQGGISSIAAVPAVAGTSYATTDPNGSNSVTGGTGTGAQVSVTTTQCATPTYACTVNWTATSSTGATATFTDINGTASSKSGALPTIQVNIGGTGGSCTTSPASGSAGPYTFS